MQLIPENPISSFSGKTYFSQNIKIICIKNISFTSQKIKGGKGKHDLIKIPKKNIHQFFTPLLHGLFIPHFCTGGGSNLTTLDFSTPKAKFHKFSCKAIP